VDCLIKFTTKALVKSKGIPLSIERFLASLYADIARLLTGSAIRKLALYFFVLLALANGFLALHTRFILSLLSTNTIHALVDIVATCIGRPIIIG